MAMAISLVGKFYNGKTRSVGSYISTNGLNNSKLYMDQEDVMFIVRMLESGNKCFNWCLENNKFKELMLYADYEGGSMKEKIDLPLKRINKQMVMNYIKKANAAAKKEIEKIYNRSFNSLTDEEKNKVYLNWSIMQPICKDEEKRIAEFNALINENSKVDKYYNIIFNA